MPSRRMDVLDAHAKAFWSLLFMAAISSVTSNSFMILGPAAATNVGNKQSLRSSGVPARVAPKAGPLPISGQQQVVSKPAGVPTPAAVRAAEASAATRRYKKRKATDKHMPEQV